MTTKLFSTLNPNALGPGLALSQGNLVVTTTQSNLNANRKVLGTLPNGTGNYRFDVQFYTTSRPTTTPVGFDVGVATTTSDINSRPGTDANSFAYNPSTGQIRSNNAVLQTVNSSPERTVITILAQIAATAKMHVFLNGTWIAVQTITAGKFWVPCLTVYGGNAADYCAYINGGQTAFDNPNLALGG